MPVRFRLLTTGGAASLALAGTLALSANTFHAQARPSTSSKLRFDVSFVPQVHDGPITGRAFVIVTRTLDKVPEPRLQIGRTGVPFFGRDVDQLQPEKIVSIDGSDLVPPVRSPESDRRPRLILWLIAGQDNSCWLRLSSRFDLSR
jgi:hypothetical protein